MDFYPINTTAKKSSRKKTAKVTYVGTVRRCAEDEENCESESSVNENKTDGHVKFSEKYVYYMNPWDEKWTFGWDARDMLENYPKQIQEQMKTAPDSKLFIGDFKYETLGFRYAVDKFLNLKVKKMILLRLKPYVLKYNSIVLGRGATEELRDGIYLIKVALQKDYLDPSAKGILIYDKKLSRDELRNRNQQILSNCFEKEITLEPGDHDYHVYDYSLNHCSGQVFLPDLYQSISQPMAKDINGENIRFYQDREGNTYSALNGEEIPGQVIGSDKRQFISIQQKLVRVLGGQIITPVEIEISDLRLMRIRNQLFIQLETVDEHKLRAATMVGNLLKSSDENYEELLTNGFQKIYDLIDKYFQNLENQNVTRAGKELSDILKEDEEIKEETDKLHEEAQRRQKKYFEEEELKSIRQQIYSIFGLDDSADDNQKKSVLEKFSQILRYRKSGLSPEAGLENLRAGLINDIIRQYKNSYRDHIDKVIEEREDFNRDPSDPWQEMMFASMEHDWKQSFRNIIQHRLNHEPDENKKKILENIKSELVNVDFSINPLTPNFSLDLLSNAGAYPEYDEDGNILPDKDKSGLPSRTFVGPLTVLLNTNGSHLRPTDVLNEYYCYTATCTYYDEIEQLNFKLDHEDQPPLPLRDSTLSVNESYEHNKYYGFLRSYYNTTVDDLIKKKREIDKKTNHQMELASQLINFVKKMRLKYTSIHNEDKSLRLREIDWEKCGEKELYEIHEEKTEEGNSNETNTDKCLSPIEPGPEILDKESFYKQLNDRAYNKTLTETVNDNLSKRHLFDHVNYMFKNKETFKSLTVDEMDELYRTKFIHPSLSSHSRRGKAGLRDFFPYFVLNRENGRREWLNSFYYNENTEKYGIDRLSPAHSPLYRKAHELSQFYYIGDKKITDYEMDRIITETIDDQNYDFKLNRDFMHRMCFVLSQNLFKDKFFKNDISQDLDSMSLEEKSDAIDENYKKILQKRDLISSMYNVEKLCHFYLANGYGYEEREPLLGSLFGGGDSYNISNIVDDLREKSDWDRPKEGKIRFSPIVMERKARVLNTTGRYVYRGGKSLNVNVSTSFSIKSSTTASVSTRSNFNPYSFVEAGLKGATVGGSVLLAAKALGVSGGVAAGGTAILGLGTLASAPILPLVILAGVATTLVGSFEISRSHNIDENQSRNSGTTVSSGTFLVTQQATLDIELGEHERCLVVRFHPAFLHQLLKHEEISKYIIRDENEKDPFGALGIMICTGKREKRCLPVQEKYFYFTQHFTDGDMFDVADLHNHPWMLQLRGMRDYMAFTSLIGAREVQADQNRWSDTSLSTLSDAYALELNLSHKENKSTTFRVVEKDSDINWTLNELGRVYFEKLPTFPGLYNTFFENSVRSKEWPWHNPDPNYILNTTNPRAKEIQSRLNCTYD